MLGIPFIAGQVILWYVFDRLLWYVFDRPITVADADVAVDAVRGRVPPETRAAWLTAHRAQRETDELRFGARYLDL